MHDAYAEARRRRLHRLLIASLWLITLLAYANSFHAGFPLDNRPLILEDNRTTAVNRANVTRILTEDYWYRQQASGLYRPFTTLSFMFNYAVLGNGPNPAGYHVVNLALHCVNVALVYFLVFHMFGDLGMAFATAVLWAVHPVLTESITNIVGRSDLLAGTAILGGLLCHRAYRSAGLAALATMGIFAKENVVVLPVLMMAYDLTFRREGWRIWRLGYVAVAPPFLLWWWVRSRLILPAMHPLTDNPLLGADFWTAKIAAIKIIGRYLAILIFPRQLSFDYSYNQIPIDGRYWLVAIGAGAVGVTATVLMYRCSKPVFFWILFSLIAFLPTSNLAILIGSVMADRFLYLPAIGFTVCVVAALIGVGRRLSQIAAPVAIALMCIVFGYRTWLRNLDWKDQTSLAASGVAASPDSFKTHMALADALSLGFPAEFERAIREIERAVDILGPLPDREKPAVAFQLAGTFYRLKGEQSADGAVWYRKARDVLLRGVTIDRTWDQRLRENQMRGGVPAARLSPFGLWRIYLQLGMTYLRLNEPKLALEALQYGRLIAPYQPDLYGFMAQAYGMLQDYNRQAITLMELERMIPREERAAQLLPGVWASMDMGGCRPTSGRGHSGRLALNLGCPIIHEQACAARQNIVKLLIAVKQEREAWVVWNEATNQLNCLMEPLGLDVK